LRAKGKELLIFVQNTICPDALASQIDLNLIFAARFLKQNLKNKNSSFYEIQFSRPCLLGIRRFDRVQFM
jgi:hypothetical protein